jgi:hypothetical protein
LRSVERDTGTQTGFVTGLTLAMKGPFGFLA